jgi:hypothetical protein
MHVFSKACFLGCTLRSTYLSLFVLVSTISHAQLLQNGGFETVVEREGVKEAPGWTLRINGSEVTDDAHSGKYAVRLWNWYYYAHGLLRYGISDTDMEDPGVALGANPGQLKGWYKYVYEFKEVPEAKDHAHDSAMVEILLFGEGSGRNEERETLAYVRHLLPIAREYTPFSIPIPLKPSVKADSISLRFESSSHGSCSAGSDGNCLYLTLDDLELVPADGNLAVPVPADKPVVADQPKPQKGKKKKKEK